MYTFWTCKPMAMLRANDKSERLFNRFGNIWKLYQKGIVSDY